MISLEDLFSPAMIRTTIWMMINFVSCVWIIWSTKICFQLGFHYATTLTALHFLLTYIGLEISACFNFFERKHVPILGVLPLSIAFCGFIVFNNLSLQYNTIGIYQVTKVLTTPVIVIINIVFYSKWLSVSETIALILVCVGVVVATEANLDLNFAGVVTGLLGVMSSSIYQIWVESKQHAFKCSPAQLLYYQAPISFLLLLPVIALTEPVGEILAFKFSLESVSAILGSALLAFLVNLSTYAVIGATSPLTYNMIGHSKLVIIILSSYLFFGERQSIIGMAGVASAVFGIIAYAQIRMTAQIEAKKLQEEEELHTISEKAPLIRLSSDGDETASTVDV
jgi:solute carrier family 35 protein E3